MTGQMKCRTAFATLVTLVLFECACTSAAGIADFASQSRKALAHGSVILSDISGSCVRRQTADLEMDDFRAGPESLQGRCAKFSEDQKGLLAASAVLTDYFAALSQLASAGSATIGKNASDAAANAAKFGSLTTTTTNATGELASLLTSLAVDGYQMKHLAADVRKADPSIAAVIEGLIAVVQKDYIDKMLSEEQQALTRRYEGFAENSDPTPVLTVLLQDRWTGDLRRLATKRSAAQAYIAALKNVKNGHAALASHSNGRSIKSLSGLLQPYTDSLAIYVASLQMQKES
jgi:hypothetical protein